MSSLSFTWTDLSVYVWVVVAIVLTAHTLVSFSVFVLVARKCVVMRTPSFRFFRNATKAPAVQQGSAGRGHAHFVGLTFIALLLLVGSLVSYAGCSTHGQSGYMLSWLGCCEVNFRSCGSFPR